MRESLFRPFDLVPTSERSDVLEKVRAINATIEGLYDFWIEYYSKVPPGLPDRRLG